MFTHSFKCVKVYVLTIQHISFVQNMELRYGYSNTVQDLAPPSETKMWSEAHPNDVATILKQFLRELPDPLLTSEYIEAFQSCGRK